MLQIASRLNAIDPASMKIIFDRIDGYKLIVGDLDSLGGVTFCPVQLLAKAQIFFSVGYRLSITS
jgi:hypothetical protein